MSLWLIRAGKYGEFEKDFLDTNKVYITWERLQRDLSKLKSRQELESVLAEIYPDSNLRRNRNHASQLWPFVSEMEKSDWVVLPSKLNSVIHVAEIQDGYVFNKNAKPPLFHSRSVKWIAKDIPRTAFDQDLLYSFGAFMAICHIQRNEAEQRVRELVARFKGSDKKIITKNEDGDKTLLTEVEMDLELLAKDQIAKYLATKFTGHDLARLVEAILIAKGFKTYRSPEGPDMGADILAASGEMGFNSPRICVQVKSGNMTVDRPTLDQLKGAMHTFKADYGLIVSWGGYKTSVNKQEAQEFFNVRIWDQDDLLSELLDVYEKLDEKIKVELPIKNVWMLAVSE